ncbi:MAG: hypothetical protein EBT79_10810 [Actinobacteria bacterium]|nr:hypothetical protein [Actinomycetota bacterium]NBR67742.1 hypothetical protein [Actinomycetota bacterium]
MSNFLLTILAAYGICFGLMNDKAAFITGPLRRIPLFPDDQGQTFFARMLSCPYCTGFHAGYIAWFMIHAHVVLTAPSWGMIGEVVATAFASSAACYLLDITAEWVEHWSSGE